MDAKTTAEPRQWEPGWLCPVCKQTRGEDGHDPCIRNLPGVQVACCGHGADRGGGYIYFTNGTIVRMKVEAVEYDDGRGKIIVTKRRRR